MNDPISWDPSLVRKYSSSNHYKLLNQLRNEVKKYPLNNKKKVSSINSIDTNDKSNYPQSQNSSYSNNSNEVISNKSSVSFNNSKNFSIYNQTINYKSKQNEISLSKESDTNEESYSQSFKERLNQIDMK